MMANMDDEDDHDDAATVSGSCQQISRAFLSKDRKYEAFKRITWLGAGG